MKTVLFLMGCTLGLATGFNAARFMTELEQDSWRDRYDQCLGYMARPNQDVSYCQEQLAKSEAKRNAANVDAVVERLVTR